MSKKNVITLDGTAQLWAENGRVSVSLAGKHLQGQPRLSTSVDSPVGKQLMAEIDRAQLQGVLDDWNGKARWRAEHLPEENAVRLVERTSDGFEGGNALIRHDSDALHISHAHGLTSAMALRLLVDLKRAQSKIDAWQGPLISTDPLLDDLIRLDLPGDSPSRVANCALKISGGFVHLGTASIPMVSADFQHINHQSLLGLKYLLDSMPSQKSYPLLITTPVSLPERELLGRVIDDRPTYLLSIDVASDADVSALLRLESATHLKRTALLTDEGSAGDVLRQVQTNGRAAGPKDLALWGTVVRSWRQFETSNRMVSIITEDEQLEEAQDHEPLSELLSDPGVLDVLSTLLGELTGKDTEVYADMKDGRLTIDGNVGMSDDQAQKVQRLAQALGARR